MFRPPTKYSEYLQDVRKSIDYILKRVNATTVTKIVAGTNVTISPADGTGVVTINSTGGGGGGLPAGGTAGQILAKIDSVNYNAEWIDNYALWTSTVKHEVKASESINKGQAVYVSTADGTNMIVSKASNTTEMTSSKTMGLLAQNLATNGKGFVVTEGLLSGLNTSGASAGDPVWLGADGNLLFGIANKPYAPLHMVSIGIVTRVNSNNGEIFVKVQNGFELDELHNVDARNPNNNDGIFYNSTTMLWEHKPVSAVYATPTLAQVTTAGNTTTNAITVGNATVNGPVNSVFAHTPTTNYTGFGGVQLNVADGTERGFFKLNPGTGEVKIGAVGSGYFTTLHTAGLERMRIFFSSGNVAINSTTDAGYKLDVNGTARVQGNLTIPTEAYILRAGSTAGSIQLTTNEVRLRGTVSTDGSAIIGTIAGTTLAKFEVNGSITAASALARGVYFNNTLVAAANNDVLVGLDINPTFTNGAFTGIQNIAVRIASTTSIVRIDSSVVGSFHGIEFSNSGNIDTEIKQRPSTGEFRISNGRFAGWGGFITLYTDTAERMRIRNNGNVLIGTTTDAGYKLDVNGTFRAVVGTETNPFRLEHTNGNYMTMIVGNGSALAAGQFGMYFNGGPMWSWNGAAFRLHGNVLSTANNPSTLILQGGYGGSTVGTSMKLSSNTPNQGQWTATSGSQITVEIGNHSNETWAPSSGNASYTLLSVAPRINTTGTYAGVVRGIYYNPTLTSLTGTTHRAIETVTGDVIFGSISGNVIIGGTTTTSKFQVNGVSRFQDPGSNSAVILTYGTGGWIQVIDVGNTEAIRLRTGGASYINTGQNFLIGTTTDAGYKLDVNGTARITGTLTVGQIINGNGTSNLIMQTHVAASSVLTIQYNGPNNATSGNKAIATLISTFNPTSGAATHSALDITHTINQTGTASGISRGIYINPTLTSVVDYRAIETTAGKVIFNGGNVGIGTTTPTELLHIVNNTNGNKFARISAGAADASAAWVAQNDQVDNIVYRVFGSGVSGFQMGIALARSASLIANLDGTGKFLIGTYSNTDIIFGTGDQSRIRVSGSNGNVMIGTLTDIGTKLNVSGEINSAGYRVNNVFGWSGTINIPTTPPISITVDGGIITNVV